MAVEVVVAVGAVLVIEWLFIRATGALQKPIPPGTPAAAATQLWTLNHALLLIGMLLGATMGMIGGFAAGAFGKARDQLKMLLFLPVPMLALLALGMVIHVRPVSLALLAVVLAAATYCRRFGPYGSQGGLIAFLAAFFGFFIQADVTMADFGWLAAEIVLGTAVTIVVHFALFRPRPEAAVRRMQRSYGARARALASDVADLYEATSRSPESAENQRAQRKLQAHLLRLNEAALLIDGQLNSPAAVPSGWSAAALHQRLYDAETALGNIARFALTVARRPLPAQASTLVLAALRGVRDGDLTVMFDRAAGLTEGSRTMTRAAPGSARTTGCCWPGSPRRSPTSAPRCGPSGCTRRASHRTTWQARSSSRRWRRSAAGCPARRRSRARPRSNGVAAA